MEAPKSNCIIRFDIDVTCNPYIDQTEYVAVAKIHDAPKCPLIPDSTTQTVDLDVELQIQQKAKEKKRSKVHGQGSRTSVICRP